MFQRRTPQEFTYIDTPKGLFTSTAQWYNIKEAHLQHMAKPVWEVTSITSVLKQCENWITSADALSTYVLIGIGYAFGWGLALIASTSFFYFWHTQKSAFASPGISGFLAFITNDALTFLLGVIGISWMGMRGETVDAVLIGILFLSFRFGWFRMAVDRYLASKSSGISLNDRLLNVMVLKTAISLGLDLPLLKRWEQEIMTASKKVGGK